MLNTLFTIFSSIIVGIFLTYINFTYFRRRIRRFSGRLYDYESVTKFASFLYNNDERIFFIDISLSDKNIKELKEDFGFLLILNKEENLHLGSLHIWFSRKDEENMFIDWRPSSKRIKGYFKVTHSHGPQQGIFTKKLAHVPIEIIYNNV